MLYTCVCVCMYMMCTDATHTCTHTHTHTHARTHTELTLHTSTCGRACCQPMVPSPLLSARDVVSQLHKDQVQTPDDFNWISQLRYYMEDGRVIVRMITTDVPYGYEYLGNSGRLVITPLTDRCYR